MSDSIGSTNSSSSSEDGSETELVTEEQALEMLEQFRHYREMLGGVLEAQLGTSLEARLNRNIKQLQGLLESNEAEGDSSFEQVCDPSIVNNVFVHRF